MPDKEYKAAQNFYKNLRLKGSKYQFKNALGIRIKCFGATVQNGHAELHERDIIVGLLEMVGPNPSFEDLVTRVDIEAFDKVDVLYGFADTFKQAWEETIGAAQ